MNERKPRRADGGRDRTPPRTRGGAAPDARSGRAAGAGGKNRDERAGRGGRGGSARGADASKRAGRDRDTGGEGRGRGAGRRDGEARARRGAGAAKEAGRSGGGARKRTSRSSDERKPTRSGIDYPSPKFRRKGETAPAPEERRTRPALRKVRNAAEEPKSPRGRRTRAVRPAPPARRRRRVRTTEATDELARLAGRNARHAQLDLARAAEAFAAGRERDAARILRPLRDAYPDASAVRELLGLCAYRLGQYQAATKELEAFVELTDSVEQHPVLMDCARALGRRRRVDELWEELAAASPSAALVSEGRIVLAGARADQGRLQEAIATLDRRGGVPNRVQEHHLRVWYALADLYERAGDLPKARELFLRVRRTDAGFSDVAERLAALG